MYFEIARESTALAELVSDRRCSSQNLVTWPHLFGCRCSTPNLAKSYGATPRQLKVSSSFPKMPSYRNRQLFQSGANRLHAESRSLNHPAVRRCEGEFLMKRTSLLLSLCFLSAALFLATPAAAQTA